MSNVFKGKGLLGILLIGCLIMVFGSAFLNSQDTVFNGNESTLEVTERQYVVSYNHGAISEVSGTDKGVNGGLLSHLWLVSGEITFKNDDDVFTVRVDEESEYRNYVMEEIYIDGSSLSDQIESYSIGDNIKISFLPDLKHEVIEPTYIIKI